jgi:hypothetical protein
MSPRLVATLLVGSLAAAQAPDNDRIQLLERQLAAQSRQLRDWSGLIRYGSENTTVGPPRPGENRVVFIGDQLTELWGAGNTYPRVRFDAIHPR